MKTKTKLLVGLPLLAIAYLFVVLSARMPEYEEAFAYPFFFFFFSAAFVFVKDSTRGKLIWIMHSLIIFGVSQWFFGLYKGFTGIEVFPKFFNAGVAFAIALFLTYCFFSISELWKNIREILGKRSVIKALISFVVSYLLFIFVFGLVYGSIYLKSDQTGFFPDKPLSLFDFFYFSAVTATTLGYGDISPADSLAKLLTVVQVFISMVIVALYFGLVINKIQEGGIEDYHENKQKEEISNDLFKSTSPVRHVSFCRHRRARRPRSLRTKSKQPGRARR
jgi:hypothetical protein